MDLFYSKTLPLSLGYFLEFFFPSFCLAFLLLLQINSIKHFELLLLELMLESRAESIGESKKQKKTNRDSKSCWCICFLLCFLLSHHRYHDQLKVSDFAAWLVEFNDCPCVFIPCYTYFGPNCPMQLLMPAHYTARLQISDRTSLGCSINHCT